MPNLFGILASSLLTAGAASLVTSQGTHLEFNQQLPRLTERSADAPEISPAATLPHPSEVEKKRLPSFSLHIRATQGKKSFMVGQKVTISIIMKNVSRSQIFFEAAPGVPQLSGFWPDLRDSRNQPVRLTDQGKKYFYGSYSTTSDILFPIEPGKTVIRQMELHELFDLSQPDQYKVRVVRSDTETKMVVKSNILKLKLTP